MMIIGIDGNEANVARKVGISEYAYQLLLQFYRVKPAGVLFHIYVKDAPRPDMPPEGSFWKYSIVKPAKLWTQIGLPLFLFTHFPRPNVFFSPTHYAPRFSPVVTTISIMDVSYLHFPELFAKKDLYQLREWTKYSARSAKHIFTISEFSKNDILKQYHKTSDEVTVTYPGIKEKPRNMTELTKKELEEKFAIRSNYILFVGTLQPRKNIERLIEALSVLLESTPDAKEVQLVIVGKKGWMYESILASPCKYGVVDRVRFLEFVDDVDLPSLYEHALMFVLPSLYEGFGLPVVEAMKYGVPVITSNVSSLPEAGGDACLYVNPENVADIAEKMRKLLQDKKLREQLIKKGYEHIKKFSWEKAAKETLDVLKEVAQK